MLRKLPLKRSTNIAQYRPKGAQPWDKTLGSEASILGGTPPPQSPRKARLGWQNAG